MAVKSASSGFFVTLRFLLPPGPTHEAHYGRPMTSAVRVIADDNRTDGSSDETGSEGRQRSTKLPNALGWKEGVADLNREECAGQKIVELERVSDGCSCNMVPPKKASTSQLSSGNFHCHALSRDSTRSETLFRF